MKLAKIHSCIYKTRPDVQSVVHVHPRFIVLMSVLFLAIRGVVQNFRVEGPSMQPTLTTGEFLWVNKAAYFEWNGQYIMGGPQRGDIAVLRPPDTTEDIDLIKDIGSRGTTVLLATHQARLATQLKRRTLKLGGGVLLKDEG